MDLQNVSELLKSAGVDKNKLICTCKDKQWSKIFVLLTPRQIYQIGVIIGRHIELNVDDMDFRTDGVIRNGTCYSNETLLEAIEQVLAKEDTASEKPCPECFNKIKYCLERYQKFLQDEERRKKTEREKIWRMNFSSGLVEIVDKIHDGKKIVITIDQFIKNPTEPELSDNVKEMIPLIYDFLNKASQ